MQQPKDVSWLRLPPRIFFKRGCLATALNELRDKRLALVVTTDVIVDAGVVSRVSAALEKLGIATRVFSEVRSKPCTCVVDHCVARINDVKPDVLIAIGGGVVMDVAKAAHLVVEHPGKTLKELVAEGPVDVQEPHKITLVCIPTTSGSGAEITPFSMLIDAETKQPITIANFDLTPDISITDADLVQSVPTVLAAQTGLAVLAHAVESYLSVGANAMTFAHSAQAARMVRENIEASVKDFDPRARENMHHAATLTGMAEANSLLGWGHALARATSMHSGVSYDEGVAIFTPVVAAHLAARCEKKAKEMSDLARFMGLAPSPDALVAFFGELSARLGVAAKVGQVRNAPSEAEWAAAADAIAADALRDPTVARCECGMTADLLKEFLRAAWE